MSFTFEWEVHEGMWTAYLHPRSEEDRLLKDGAKIAEVHPLGEGRSLFRAEVLSEHSTHTVCSVADGLRWANHKLWHLGFTVEGWPPHEQPSEMSVEWTWSDWGPCPVTGRARKHALIGWLDLRTSEQRVEGSGVMLGIIMPRRPGMDTYEYELIEAWEYGFKEFEEAKEYVVSTLKELGYLVPPIPPEP